MDNRETKSVIKSFENLSGIFYVPDASTEMDHQGRKVIVSEQLKDENVKTVFGYGGCYLGTSLFFVTIVFLQDFLERKAVEPFVLQSNQFKTVTMNRG